MNNRKQLKKITKELKNITNKLNNLQKEIDFSKWIGRDGNILAIKGDKYLISYADGDVSYTNRISQNFTDTITYREDVLENLQIGDVFILKNDLNNIKIKDFNIFIAKDAEDRYIFQYLIKYLGVEQIEYFSTPWYHYEEVIVFNRK